MNDSSRYPDVLEPMPMDEAFQSEGGRAAQSRAAGILMLGRAMRAPRRAEPGEEERGSGDPGGREMMPEEDLQELGMDLPLGELPREKRHGERELGRMWSPGQRVSPSAAREAQAELWESLRGDMRGRTVARLTWASCFDEDPLVRVAAATAYDDSILDPGREAAPLAILEAGIDDPDPDVAALAEVGLARMAPDHPRLRELQRRDREPGPAEPAHTSLMVHGTFARTNDWWQPGGDFHGYILQDVDSSLYAGGDRFDWSGGYSDAARALAAIDLMAWVKDHGVEGLDLFCHSHGGSAAMLATRGGLELGRIVLLSCPVHDRYTLDFNRVNRAVSVRVRSDLVILADRGGQRFTDPNIEENRLPVWFKHSASHDVEVWKQHDVPSLI